MQFVAAEEFRAALHERQHDWTASILERKEVLSLQAQVAKQAVAGSFAAAEPTETEHSAAGEAGTMKLAAVFEKWVVFAEAVAAVAIA